MLNLKQIDDYLNVNRQKHLEKLFEFIRIPSISPLKENKKDMLRAANWLKDYLEDIGLRNVSIEHTKGHPIVYADWLNAGEKPTLLMYGHYDVQPIDPIDLWDSNPFEPEIRDKKLYSRGSSDDKGQLFMHILVVEAILNTHGELPVNVKFVLEGEEETGSPSLSTYLENNKEKLNTDIIVIHDTIMKAPNQPSICYGLRGLCGVEIDVKGPIGDLHSGLYGGGVQNPIHALINLLSTFRNEDGEILIDGFYDKVEKIKHKEKDAISSFGFNEDKLKKELGVSELFGEKGYTYLEQTWVRPTLEINGIYGGFSGEGSKTVLPSKAGAKITCRLVPNQDPDDITEKIIAHINKNKPKGVTLSISKFDNGPPFYTSYDHPAIKAAARSYEKVYKTPTSFARMGGSIPIVAEFKSKLNATIVMMGFGLETENFHAPNEHFHLENFDKGLRVISNYYGEIANLEKEY